MDGGPLLQLNIRTSNGGRQRGFQQQSRTVRGTAEKKGGTTPDDGVT